MTYLKEPQSKDNIQGAPSLWFEYIDKYPGHA